MGYRTPGAAEFAGRRDRQGGANRRQNQGFTPGAEWDCDGPDYMVVFLSEGHLS